MSMHSTRQLEFNFYVRPVKLKSTQCFNLHKGVEIWNNLPEYVETISKFHLFKRVLKSHLYDLHNDIYV